jgi:hypothetical protein
MEQRNNNHDRPERMHGLLGPHPILVTLVCAAAGQYEVPYRHVDILRREAAE